MDQLQYVYVLKFTKTIGNFCCHTPSVISMWGCIFFFEFLLKLSVFQQTSCMFRVNRSTEGSSVKELESQAVKKDAAPKEDKH